MSLTSFLETKDVRERFYKEFPKPKFNIKKKILAPPLTDHYSLVGTAFDYLLRFYLEYLNPKAVTHKWVAEHVLSCYPSEARTHLPKVEKIINQAKENHLVFLRTGELNDEIIKSALLLAQIDPIFRAGIIDKKIGTIDPKDIKDLKQLITIVTPDIFKAKKICILNPTFGEACRLVGGADTDLILDDVIVDIKTTKKLTVDRYSFNQLIGYYILYKIGGIEGAPQQYKIKKLGIYFSRYAYLYVSDVKDIVDKKTFPFFIKWFKKKAKEIFL